RLLAPGPARGRRATLFERDVRRRLDEVRGAGGVDQLARNDRGDTAIPAHRQDLIDEIARLAGAKRTPRWTVVPAVEVGDHHLVEAQLAALADHFENACELLQRRIGDRNLVRDAAQERFVGQRLRIEVRRKHAQDVERYLELLPGVKSQVINAALQRDDPAIEQIFRPHALPSEIVNQQHAAVRFHLQRCFVVLGNRIEVQVEHRQREFTADDDNRPTDSNPSTIARCLGDQPRREPLFVDRLVADWIEYRDDLPFDVDGVWHVHMAAERAAEALADDGLAVTRGAEQKDGLSRVDGGPQLVEQAAGHDEMREALLEPPAI